MPFWDERVAEMQKSYPDVTVRSYHIDALTTYFVSVSPCLGAFRQQMDLHLSQRPASFDVVVGSNLFGDVSPINDINFNYHR